MTGTRPYTSVSLLATEACIIPITWPTLPDSYFRSVPIQSHDISEDQKISTRGTRPGRSNYTQWAFLPFNHVHVPPAGIHVPWIIWVIQVEARNLRSVLCQLELGTSHGFTKLNSSISASGVARARTMAGMHICRPTYRELLTSLLALKGS